MTLDDIKAIADVIGDVSTLTPDEQYTLELYHRGEPAHFTGPDGKMHPRTRPPDRVVVPKPTFLEPTL